MSSGKFNQNHIRSAKLTPSQVQELRRLYEDERWSQGRLARHFSMSISQIGRIVRHESWHQYGEAPAPTGYTLPTSDEIQNSEERFRLLANGRPEEALAIEIGIPDPLQEPTGEGLAKLMTVATKLHEPERKAEAALDSLESEPPVCVVCGKPHTRNSSICDTCMRLANEEIT